MKCQITTLYKGSKDWMTQTEIENVPTRFSFSVKGSHIYLDEITHNLERSLVYYIFIFKYTFEPYPHPQFENLSLIPQH